MKEWLQIPCLALQKATLPQTHSLLPLSCLLLYLYITYNPFAVCVQQQRFHTITKYANPNNSIVMVENTCPISQTNSEMHSLRK